jgi:KaiC/GvpD/RAD55 family RecA-like ATPase
MGGFVTLHKTVADKGKLLTFEEFTDTTTLEKYMESSPSIDWYSSLFVYDESVKDHFAKTGSIAKFPGKAYSNTLVFDFDCKENLDKARDEVKLLVRKLKDIGVNPAESCRVYFSGSKGFHVTVETSDSFSPSELKIICKNIAKGLATFDTVIYDSSRKFRINNTKHNKTGLYKIELTGKQLNSLSEEEIKKLAENKVYLNKTTTPCNLDFRKDFLVEERRVAIIESSDAEEVNGVRGLAEINFDKCPKDRPKCIHALLQGVMVPNRGERNHIILHIGNYLRNQGHDKEAVYGYLKGLSRKNSALYPEVEPYSKERIWNEIIPRVFNGTHNTSGWGVSAEDEVFKNYCKSIPHDKPCPLHNKVEKPDLVKINDVFNSFSNFAENFEDNIVPTGIQFIDDYMKICAGTVTLLVGACGSGKTTLCLNIMENTNDLGMHTVFFSLDMHKNLVYLKLAQKLTDYTQDEILNIFKSKNTAKINEIREKIDKKYSRTFFDFSGTLTMDDMKQRVLDIQEKHGVDIKLVVVDYAGRISGPYSDSYANAKYNALRSKDVADDTNAAWVLLSQVSRNTGDGSTPIRTKRAAKDSGDFEEAASNVLTVWRPKMGMEGQISEDGTPFEDDVMSVFLAKNRMGRELEAALYWNGAKGIIRDMTEEEKAYHESVGKNLEREAQKLKKGF